MGTPSFGTVLVILLFTICHQTLAAPYTKYGRSCSDIGCLPSEVCMMTQDSCSYGQRDGKECGRYPTCKKSGSVSPTDNDNTFSNHNSNTNPIYDPPTTKKPTYGGGGSAYPSLPSSNSGGGGGYTPPAYNPGYNPGGIYGGGGGYDPYATTRRTTKAPSIYGGGGGYNRPASTGSSSSGGFSGFFSGLQNALSGQIGSLIQNALTGKGGFLDTRTLLDNRRTGGSLFSENTNTASRGSQTNTANTGRASYPTQAPLNYGAYAQNTGSRSSQSSYSNMQPTTPKYGWNIH